MTIFDIYGYIALGALVIALLIKRKDGVIYTALDKRGKDMNIILSIIYIPMSFMAIFTMFFFDDPSVKGLSYSILTTAVSIGFLTPIISIIGIFLSIVLRKRGKSVLSFKVQFAGLISFGLVFLLVMLAAAVKGI